MAGILPCCELRHNKFTELSTHFPHPASCPARRRIHTDGVSCPVLHKIKDFLRLLGKCSIIFLCTNPRPYPASFCCLGTKTLLLCPQALLKGASRFWIWTTCFKLDGEWSGGSQGPWPDLCTIGARDLRSPHHYSYFHFNTENSFFFLSAMPPESQIGSVGEVWTQSQTVTHLIPAKLDIQLSFYGHPWIPKLLYKILNIVMHILIIIESNAYLIYADCSKCYLGEWAIAVHGMYESHQV